MNDLGPEYITAAELCRRLSISRSTIYRHHLPRFAIYVGSQWRYHWPSVLAWYQRGTARITRTD
jgi:predicted DNA-binding transcriptional regulator AlpA